MEKSTGSTLLFTSKAKPLCYSQGEQMIAVGEESERILIINKHELKSHFALQTGRKDRTLSLKLKDNLLVRGSNQGTVTLWDNRQLTSSSPIHTFQRPGSKFTALDISEHILAGGTSKRIIFWDLRKMKQRCQFTESFNEEITDITFSPVQKTVFHACSMDGLVAKFDLAEKSEEDAFIWGNQINQSPRKLQVSGIMALVQTQNEAILRLQDQAINQKWNLNTPQQPTHILSSFLDPQRYIHYFTKNMRNNLVQYWIEKHNVGIISTKVDIQLLIPIANTQTIFSDSEGNWYYSQVTKGQNSNKVQMNQNFMTIEESELREGKIVKQQICNKNGFIISKPNSLKNTKKFKPY